MLLGEQMLVRSQTGTGKTIAMIAGVLHQLRSFCTEEERKGKISLDGKSAQNTIKVGQGSLKVLIMVPTRELGWQVSFYKYLLNISQILLLILEI